MCVCVSKYLTEQIIIFYLFLHYISGTAGHGLGILKCDAERCTAAVCVEVYVGFESISELR